MKKDALFATWAPKGGVWTPWVKPVLFAHADDVSVDETDLPAPAWVVDAVAVDAGHHRASARSRDVAFIVDRPARSSIRAGLALAERGFFPVPLFNALPHDLALIDMRPAIAALIVGAPRRAAVSLPSDAPPAFLLDSRRSHGAATRAARWFDNRSVMFETDFPSADRLLGAGIARVVLVQGDAHEPARDLVPMLLGWQAAGLSIQLKRTDEPGGPRSILVRHPSPLRRMIEWLGRTTLHRDPSGAFGELIERSAAGG